MIKNNQKNSGVRQKTGFALPGGGQKVTGMSATISFLRLPLMAPCDAPSTGLFSELYWSQYVHIVFSSYAV